MRRRHDMPFGARLDAGGGATFRLWAPTAKSVDLVRSAGPDAGSVVMRAQDEGWFEADVAHASSQTRYAFRIDGDLVVPDPASRFNPDDVHAPSALIDPEAFDWTDHDWRGRPWHEAVVYELHVGTFTAEGTFAAVVERLDDLVALGITAIELMPVADFPGRRNWGYDGVLPFAPDASYGTPNELKRLVVEAHARGLMVLLDVVYNHFGPDGNYLHAYAGTFFNPQHATPWGAAINFDGAGSRTVRDFFIHNALYWLEEFHFDGLRLDAVHAMPDTSPRHFVDELAVAVRSGPGRDRHVHLVLENDHNEARRLARDPGGGTPLSTAQWNDDLHHAAHVLATGERDGYYADYAERALWLFGRALAEGFGYQGEPSPYREGALRGEPSTALPPGAFVDYLQTHDQVGNRALGDRLCAVADAQPLRALAACVLLAPATPMLFMGEEYAASTPFLYFCDFHGELAAAVTHGRRAEFERFERFADPAMRERIPDPNDARTFAASKLKWDERDRGEHAEWLGLYRRLLQVRSERIVPLLPSLRSGSFELPAPGCVHVQWPAERGRRLHLVANLSPLAAAVQWPPGDVIYASGVDSGAMRALAPWAVRVTLGTS